ncbi:unnamed protein product [Effrenium voratum]|nr:unnamed protein product [Effrenium voratum]
MARYEARGSLWAQRGLSQARKRRRTLEDAQLLFRGADAVVQAEALRRSGALPKKRHPRLAGKQLQSTGLYRALQGCNRARAQLLFRGADAVHTCTLAPASGSNAAFLHSSACSGAFQGCVRTRAELLLRGADAAVQNLFSCRLAVCLGAFLSAAAGMLLCCTAAVPGGAKMKRQPLSPAGMLLRCAAAVPGRRQDDACQAGILLLLPITSEGCRAAAMTSEVTQWEGSLDRLTAENCRRMKVVQDDFALCRQFDKTGKGLYAEVRGQTAADDCDTDMMTLHAECMASRSGNKLAAGVLVVQETTEQQPEPSEPRALPLHLAVAAGNLELVQHLLRHGAVPNEATFLELLKLPRSQRRAMQEALAPHLPSGKSVPLLASIIFGLGIEAPVAFDQVLGTAPFTALRQAEGSRAPELQNRYSLFLQKMLGTEWFEAARRESVTAELRELLARSPKASWTQRSVRSW